MTIYIESFIFQNVLINSCLLKLIYLTTKTKTSLFKMFLACIIGAIPSVLVVTIINNNMLINLSKLLTSLLMISIAFNQSKKQFVFNTILLFLYTYTFSGIITSLSSSVYLTSFGAVTTSKFNIETICLIFIVFTSVFELVVKHIKFKIKTNNLIYNIKLTQNNKSIKINAYMDTGNFINLNGEPVLILDLNAYLKLTKSNLINFLKEKTATIQTLTINGRNNLKILKINKLEIQNKKNPIIVKDVLVAINTSNCFKNTNYQALLSPLFL